MLTPMKVFDEKFTAPPSADEWRALAITMSVLLAEQEGAGRSGARLINDGLDQLRATEDSPLLPAVHGEGRDDG